MAEKEQLLSDLEQFDLNNVDCRLESWSCSSKESRDMKFPDGFVCEIRNTFLFLGYPNRPPRPPAAGIG